MLTVQEKNRYARHIMLPEIGEKGQEKLKNASVIVIGAGGLGCAVLQYLVAAGVGRVRIVDNDAVSESNLPRQILYTMNDIGQPKVRVVQQRLSSINPFVVIEAINDRLLYSNAREIFEPFQIIIDASDNYPTRYLINDYCVTYEKTWVYGAVSEHQGQISVFNFEGSGTYRCLFPNPPEDDPAVPAVLGVTPGVIGCLQAGQAIKLICNIEGVLSDKLLNYDLLTMTQKVLSYRRVESETNHILAKWEI